jgi:hypothetical protein
MRMMVVLSLSLCVRVGGCKGGGACARACTVKTNFNINCNWYIQTCVVFLFHLYLTYFWVG